MCVLPSVDCVRLIVSQSTCGQVQVQYGIRPGSQHVNLWAVQCGARRRCRSRRCRSRRSLSQAAVLVAVVLTAAVVLPSVVLTAAVRAAAVLVPKLRTTFLLILAISYASYSWAALPAPAPPRRLRRPSCVGFYSCTCM